MSVRVREIVASVIERQVKDPRLGMVTVTDARMTPDLREATVFYTVWGDDAVRADTAQALESAKGVIRSAVGRGTGLKHTPSLAFVLDAVPDTARHIEEVLEKARHADESVHAIAERASYAGTRTLTGTTKSENRTRCAGGSSGAVNDGLVIVDKPAGWTSHDVVARLRKLAGTRRVGHAGTLDPMATGVLVVGVGRATKLLGHLALHDKDYDATMRLGVRTTTDDADGDVVAACDAAALTDGELASAVASFVGDIDQVPAAVSAVKVNGARAYSLARKGESVELAARRVHVARFDVVARRGDDVDVQVTCSTGTYVRALARDVGQRLGVGAHLTRLRRTRVGALTVDRAKTLDELAVAFDLVGLDLAVAEAFPRIDIDADATRRLSRGQRVDSSGLPAGMHGVFGPDGHVVALAEERDGRLKTSVVFTPAS